MASKLGNTLLHELLVYALQSETNYSIVFEHMDIKNFIIDEDLRTIYHKLKNYKKKNGKLPTLSVLENQCGDKVGILDHLEEISDIRPKRIDEETIIREYEDFIRAKKFVTHYTALGEMYQKGEREKAFELFEKASNDVMGFSLARGRIDTVIGDFNQRLVSKMINLESDFSNFNIPFGVPALDRYCHGVEKGDMALVMAKSGGGKTTYLIHQAIHAARRGYNVLYFHGGDGTKQQLLDKIDSAWTGESYRDIKKGNFEDEKVDKWRQRFLDKIKGEIYVEAFDSLERRPSVADINSVLFSLAKKGIKIHMVCVDYLELMEPVEQSYKDENERQGWISRELKNLAVHWELGMVTATQSTRIKAVQYNDPDFVMTSENIAESISKIKPVDFFFTFNITAPESKQMICRIFVDKNRHGRKWFIAKVYQSLEKSRFVDKIRTMEKFGTKIYPYAA